MDTTLEKLSRISALRPRDRVSRPGATASPHSDKLIELLDGERRTNGFGSHILIRRSFPQNPPGKMSDRALRLLAPDAAEEIADPALWLFLDTETTGLAGGTGTCAFLVGLGRWDGDGFVTEQHFMRDFSEETPMLSDILERLTPRSVLVTFNGKSFDWPLLQTRFAMRRLGAAPAPAAHLDFLYPARQLWRFCCGSVALTELERRVLGLNRAGDIPSAAIPQIYFDFLRGGPAEPMAGVIRHNQMDLVGLAALAVHVLDLLADPETSRGCSEELFGVSRLLQRRGEERLAGRIYRRALEGGLPKAAERIACRELALLAKREGDFELSNELWGKLLDDTAEGLKAYEQLAIYYEHRARSPEKAAALSREALVRLQEAWRRGRVSPLQYRRWHASLQHRLNRLALKLAGPRSGAAAARAEDPV
ncbi:MAG: ribonuclease H-like domain-containing protein [Rubrivivax sp.]|nr:ribonuclease H-like domain-containing protein [Rubrivivax sp.]